MSGSDSFSPVRRRAAEIWAEILAGGRPRPVRSECPGRIADRYGRRWAVFEEAARECGAPMDTVAAVTAADRWARR